MESGCRNRLNWIDKRGVYELIVTDSDWCWDYNSVRGLGKLGKVYLSDLKKSKKGRKEDAQLGLRLDDIDRRLTDVQDVMIAFSKKDRPHE